MAKWLQVGVAMLALSVSLTACGDKTSGSGDDPDEQACSTEHLDGSCPSGHVCQNGACVEDTVACSPATPVGLCPACEICDGDTTSDTFGSCVTAPCSAACLEGRCNDPEQLCEDDGVCRVPPCSPETPWGTCDDPEQLCEDDGVCRVPACSPETPWGTCDDPEQLCEDDGVCRVPPCSPETPWGTCDDGLVCDDTGHCVEQLCSPTHPEGRCADARAECIDGACVVRGCVADASLCNPYSELCDTQQDRCVRMACDDRFDQGRCPLFGEACLCNPEVDCTDFDPLTGGSVGGHDYFTCQMPPCTRDACVGAEGCSDHDGDQGACLLARCFWYDYPGGVCADGLVCAAGTCIEPHCSNDAPTGTCPEPLRCIEVDGDWGCRTPDCGVDDSSGACVDATQVCARCSGDGCELYANEDDCTVAGCSWNDAWACVQPTCGNANPSASCAAYDLCADASGGTGCDAHTDVDACLLAPGCEWLTHSCLTLQGDTECVPLCAYTAPDGYCPPGAACVLGACTSACVDDRDCDGIPDALEQGEDWDGDGFDNDVDTDSDGDGIPDDIEYDGFDDGLTGTSTAMCVTGTPPCDSDDSGSEDFRDPDSDNDGISDAIEAGPDASAPRDSDADGSFDFQDPDSDGDGIFDLLEGQADPDGDGIPNYLDGDSDDDGVPDALEGGLCLGSPECARYSADDCVDNGCVWTAGGTPANGAGGSAYDYLDLDSDGDGLADADEDRNGNGIADCQIDDDGNIVYVCASLTQEAVCTARGCTWTGDACEETTGVCDTTCGSIDATPYRVSDVNPGCWAGGARCLLTETSRVVPDSDCDGIADGDDGEAAVCGAGGNGNLNPVRSIEADFSLSLEAVFDDVATLSDGGVEIGATFNETSYGSLPVAGFVLSKPPCAEALAVDDANLEERRRNQVIAQEACDRSLLNTYPLSQNGGVQVVLSSFGDSFDGFPTGTFRYHFDRNGDTSLNQVRAEVVSKLWGASPDGLDTSSAGPSEDLYTLIIQTVYRTDPNAETGHRVVLLGAVVRERDYGSCRSLTTSTACGYIGGCDWDGSACHEADNCEALGTAACLADDDCTYDADGCHVTALPMVYVDNLTAGGAIAQYGAGVGSTCQGVVQSPSAVDYLWVIDISGSMDQNIDEVRVAAERFVPLLLSTEADFQSGMTTSFHKPDRSSSGNVYQTSSSQVNYPPDFSHFGGTYHHDGVNDVGSTTNNYLGYLYAEPNIEDPGDAGSLLGNFTTRNLPWAPVDCAVVGPQCDAHASRPTCEADADCTWEFIDERAANSYRCTPRAGHCYNCAWESWYNDDEAEAPAYADGWYLYPRYCDQGGGVPPDTPFHCSACTGGPADGWLDDPLCHFLSKVPCAEINHGQEFGLWMAAWALERARANPDFNGPVAGETLSGPPSEPDNLRAVPPSHRLRDDVPTIMIQLSDEEARWLKFPRASGDTTYANSRWMNNAKRLCRFRDPESSYAGGDNAVYHGALAGSAATWAYPLAQYRNYNPGLEGLTQDEIDNPISWDVEDLSPYDWGTSFLERYDNEYAADASYDDSRYERLCRERELGRYFRDRGVLVFSLAGAKGASTCGGVEAGNGYIAIAEMTGGGYGDICATNSYPTLESVITTSLGLASPYRLRAAVDGKAIQPIAASIRVAAEVCDEPSEYPDCDSGTHVQVIHRSRENGFEYNAQYNTIILYGSARPQWAKDIVAGYRYWVRDDSMPAQGYTPDRCQRGNDAGCTETWTACVLHDGDAAACGATDGCAYNDTTGVCEVLDCSCPAGNVCDPVANQCAVDAEFCSSANCVDAQTCSGAADRDMCEAITNGGAPACRWLEQTLPGGTVVSTCEPVQWQPCNADEAACACASDCGDACSVSETCDSDLDSGTCGECFCDTGCGDGCLGQAACDDNSGCAGRDQDSCTTTSGCTWMPNSHPAPATAGLGACVSATCGQCVCDNDCNGACSAYEQCNPDTCQCACDTTCGGGCGFGQHCDADPESPSCGACLCEADCGGATCGAGQVCDDNAACASITDSTTCDAQPGCSYDAYLDACLSDTCGACVCDTTCAGGCGEGAICDTDRRSSTCGSCLVDVDCCLAGADPAVWQCDPVIGVCTYIGE